jgi:transcription elongation factor Elf1/stalled ribosome alternative rescue factor ArfA
MLNARGILSPAEYKKAMGISYHTPFSVGDKAEWSPNAVKRILTNRVYLGHLEQGKRTKASYRMKQLYYKPREAWSIHENAHEPIISDLDFELAQELMAMDTRIAQGNERLHLFSGFVVCGLCGQVMTAKTTTKKGEKSYVNYICSTHKKTGECQNNNVSEKKLYDIVLDAIRQQAASFASSDDATVDFTAAAMRGRKQVAIEGMIERNLLAIKENGEYLVKSYEHFVDEVISESEYQMFKKSFNAQIQSAEGNIASLREELNRLDSDTNARRLIERFIEQENISELDRRIVSGLIKSITVKSNNSISVQFRYVAEMEIAPFMSVIPGFIDEREKAVS